MSLDVYLEGDPEIVTETHTCADCEDTHEVQREVRDHYYSRNITHNLGLMAGKAGPEGRSLYCACWRGGCDEDSDVNGLTGKRASDLIPMLREGLADLKARPDYFEQFNAENGWGMYKHFVPFVESYLEACETYPNAWVRISR
jgi:hypothetical protein